MIFILCASTPPPPPETTSLLHNCLVICGTHGLGTLVTVIYIRSFVHLIFIVLNTLILAMLVALAKVLDCCFLNPIKLLHSLLLCCVVMFGRHVL
jgi:hypothetical protein